MPSLFDPIVLGDIHAPNRVLMAPLTRGRATREHVPTAIMAEYYAQRASAGLLISEGTGISREGLGWPYAPGLWTDEQVEAWKPVTDAVHAAGGRIVTQLWHMGRVVHPDFLAVRDGLSASATSRPAWLSGDGGPHPDFRGDRPLSASATTAPGQAHTYDGKKPYGEARAATLDDIARVLDDYSRAARNAKAAGFDGVQLHAANGYLIDQFLRDGANHRDDAYGGSPENRIRLLGEVVDRLIAEVGAGRTSVRFSPNGDTQGVIDSDPASVFVPAAKLLSDKGIAFLELREPGPDGTFGSATQPRVSPEIRKVFAGPLVLNQDYRGANAQAELDAGIADAIAFGRPFLANPDLPHRLERGADLTPDDMATWYSRGPEGYTDYPVLAREAA